MSDFKNKYGDVLTGSTIRVAVSRSINPLCF